MSNQNTLELVSLEVNGHSFTTAAEDRISVADVLREKMDLTGTHLGCEQGVCGACTVEINGVPSRSCITFAKSCQGAKVRTIEGYDDDPIMAALRDAFSEHHALQCGFCTPGMLVSSYDIVKRGEASTEEQVRVALSGNLCRCTGYQGIVNAVMSVLSRRDEFIITPSPEPASQSQYKGELPLFERTTGKVDTVVKSTAGEGGDNSIVEKVKLSHSEGEVWSLLRDVEQVIPCVPGATLLEHKGEQLKIQMEASFGAISAKFQGDGRFIFDDEQHEGRFEGEGKDARSGSGAKGTLHFHLIPDGDNSCWLELEASWEVSGALSQFSRGGLIKSFASAITRMFVNNLAKRLKGEAIDPSKGAKLSLIQLIWAVLSGWFKR
ncbi:2Fe-2S iron-sulfur cluster-binding protein [Oceanisphaera sediminis]|uniref:2Fe-2S iron-sulfur cluster-binding protein n=2 Tax=Oceanisphaera sediminis TaxID=981381 RepID=A0ABP7DQL5_9GAMM